MRIDILTLFPQMFESVFSHSILKRAQAKRLLKIRVHNLRDWAKDRHRTCDDRPFGGGPGMLLKPEPIFEAAKEILGRSKKKPYRFIYLTPQGVPFNQKKAEELAAEKHLIFLCGHYEGVDERVVEALVTDSISIGDYVLTGGELPAMVVVDALARFLKGVLGQEASREFESFRDNLLEYPQYTRPADYRGLKVPAVLLSGNHKAIAQWRKAQSKKRTRKDRPDLLKHASPH